MSPSPLPGVLPLVATSKSSQSPTIHHHQQNLAIASTSYGLIQPLNIPTKSTNTMVVQQQQSKNQFIQPPKMIVQNDKKSNLSDNNKNINNLNDINGKDTILPSLNETILLNKIVNNTKMINNKNDNNFINNDKNQLIDNVKIKEENDNQIEHKINDKLKHKNDNKKIDKKINIDNHNKKSILFDVSKKREILLKNLNKQIICNLCQGYLIDATTIVECLHSFCHSCIMKHLRTEQYCPRCEMMINHAKPNIKPDTTLQAIVYKIVPGLYEKELMRKRAFYRDRPEDAAIATPEQRGEDTEHLIFSPTENMSLSLEYADIGEIPYGSDDIYGLKTPKYLQCPASLTVAHLKKFVLMKFAIDSELFMVEIMYKVKTIVLYDHYTLMDVAYIYTWKRDAPMRFFFRVKETDNYAIKLDKLKRRVPVVKTEVTTHNLDKELTTKLNVNISETKIKVEPIDNNKLAIYDINKEFEIVQSPKSINTNSEMQKTEKIKITLVGKNKYPKITSSNQNLIKSSQIKLNSDEISKKLINNGREQTEQQRKPENIKMKIDISKQNSIKIINMSGPDSMPKEIVKSVKPEKEWKIKTKTDDNRNSLSPKLSTKDSDKKRKLLSPLTVPPITIKAEKLSPVPKYNSSKSPIPKDDRNSPKFVGEKDEEEKKSEFLNSFALTPIKNVSPEKQSKAKVNNTNPISEIKVVPTKNLMGPPLKPVGLSSKRKNKDPIKTASKKPKFDFADILTPENFAKKRIDKDNTNKQQQPKEMISFGLAPYPIGGANTTIANNNTNNCDVLINGKPLHKFNNNNDEKLMPAPSSLKVLEAVKKNGLKTPKSNDLTNKNMKFPMTNNKHNNNGKSMIRTHPHIAPPGSTTPHPMIPSGIASSKASMTSPGNRTPITKRYPTILPKQTVTNPFANIPTEVNKILKESGTEIKHVQTNDDCMNSIKVYGPTMNLNTNSNQSLQSQNLNKNTANNNHSYLNFALYNASKTRGNEVPPGCRTPMYTPNSPIYSPNSPQYIQNYNISTQPTYKYTPKSATNVNNYLQNVLGQNKQMSSLFPGPPIKKSDDNVKRIVTSPTNNIENDTKKVQNDNNNKINYPFSKTPPINNNEKIINNNNNKTEPEKQIKVKSLLTSCNINIPSSLSITITNEDSDSKTNNSLNPKHKSPVNNYIEILKLPDQTLQEQNNNNNNNDKTDQQQQQNNQIKDETPTKKKDNEISNISITNNMNITSSGITKTVMTINTPRSSPMAFTTATTKTTISPSTTNLCITPTPITTSPITTPPNKLMTPLNPNDKKLIETPKKSPSGKTKENKSINNTKNLQNVEKTNGTNNNNKKTASPDKKSPSANTNDSAKKRQNSDKKTSPENGQKSSKNHDTNQQPPIKKFRHILPRTPTTTLAQTPVINKQTVLSPMTPQKPSITKNIVIHQQQQQQQQNQKSPSANLVGIRTNFPNTSNGCIVGIKTTPQITKTTNNSNMNNLKKNDVNYINALIKSPITSTQQQQSQSININNLNNNNNNNIDNNLSTVTVNSPSNNIQRSNTNEMANFLNETILRAAAVNAANVAAVNNTNINNGNNSSTNTNSNIFLPHLAAAAANFGQFASINFNPYNFQQAIVLEQYARYKAGQDALEKLAQNIKNNSNNNNKNNNSNSPKGSTTTATTPPAILNGTDNNSSPVNNDAIKTATITAKEKST